jgi:hypothetical protein
MNPDADDLIAALESLFESDQRWRPLPMPGGATITRSWDDESVDTVVVLSPDTAYAVRDDPHGREIQRIRGTAREVITAVRAWPPPSEPNAPNESGHTPHPSGLWT